MQLEQTSVLDYLLPQFSSCVLLLFLEQSHCSVVAVAQTLPTKTLFHFLLPFCSALHPQLSLTPLVVPFLFKVSSADSVKDKSKSEPEEHPLLFIIAQN